MIKKVIKKYKNSKEAITLTENFLSLSVLQLVGYIFPLITLPYLARVLGLEKFGILAFAAAMIAYFNVFVDFGFDYTAVRDIAKNKTNKVAVSRIFSSVMTVRGIFTVVSLFILFGLILIVPLFKENIKILLLTFSSIPASILFPAWFFQAMERMKFTTILNLLSKLLFTILVFVVIRKQEDYYWQPVLSACGFLFAGIISLIIIRKEFGIKYKLPNSKDISDTIRNGWDMFINLFLPNLYTNFSTILLRAYSGEAATGIFDAGNKFVTIAQQIANVLSRTFYPFLARRLDKHDFYLKISFIVSLLMSLTLFFGADLIIKIFYTSDFKEAAIVLKILALSIVFLFLMNAFGTNYLVLVNQEKKLKKIIVWCSVFGFGLSWYAVIKWGFIGAAITLLVVWILRGIITWRVAVKYKKQLND